MITHVAIRYEGKIHSLPRPARHHDVIRKIGGISGPDVQGFLTESGVFLNRREALFYALEHGQIQHPSEVRSCALYSEDLW